jgi:enoyl-CoA hydratase
VPTAYALRLGFVHEAVARTVCSTPRSAALTRCRRTRWRAYAFTKRALQAPALANIERLADPLDDQLAKGFSDPGSLRVQRAKYEQLTGRVPDTEVG